MWKRIILGLILSVMLCSRTSDSPGPADAARSIRPGVVLARFDAQLGPQAMNALLDACGLRVESELAPLRVVSLRAPTGREWATIESLRRAPGVLFAEPDYVAQAALLPNDPTWGQQWALSKINAPAAWDVTTGTVSVTIAIVDSGIDLDHPDLVSKLWTNPGEIPGNWIDDDGNGKTDDVHGWRFYRDWNFNPVEDADVQDDFGHGTHVAGIAAAATNNGTGVAGVAWGARVMPVKVLDQYGWGFYSDIAAGIVYAADNGARIINLSLGGASASETLCAAVEYARSKGAAIVAAAGNSGGAVYYPAACSGALAVAATDPADNRAGFSNHGPEVDLAAPGVDIYSAWPWVSGYYTKSGTSMAAPHVSGVGALVWSRWPELSANAVATQITQTVVDVASLGWDEYTGWGRLDAASAVMTLTVPPDLWIHVTAPALVRANQVVSYQLLYGNGGGVAYNVCITATLPASLNTSDPLTFLVPLVPAASGPYQLTITATVSPDAPAGAALTTTAIITSNLELDSFDNASWTVARVVSHSIFLPLVLSDLSQSQ
jgi:hypothetical protein